MLNDNFVAPKKEASNYSPLPDDMYQVELLDITSEKRPTYDTRLLPADQQVFEDVLNFQFTVLEENQIDGKSVRGRNIFENFVPSFLYIGKNGKNTLYQIVESLQAQTVSPEQEALGITGKHLNALIRKQCRVITKQQKKGDKTYMNIEGFLPAKAPLAPLTEKEREDAMMKPKHDEAEKESDVPFESKAPVATA